jgi:hypothetical protein
MRIDMLGKRFGRLTVVALEPKRPWETTTRWRCRCDCGQRHITSVTSLRNGRATKCRSCYLHAKTPWQILVSQVHNSYRGNARKRNLAFPLTRDETEALISKPCAYCGGTNYRPHARKRHALLANSACNGIDRLHNDIGYELSNCVPCCSICNRAKLDLTAFEWKLYLDRLLSHQSSLSNSPQTPGSPLDVCSSFSLENVSA